MEPQWVQVQSYGLRCNPGDPSTNTLWSHCDYRIYKSVFLFVLCLTTLVLFIILGRISIKKIDQRSNSVLLTRIQNLASFICILKTGLSFLALCVVERNELVCPLFDHCSLACPLRPHLCTEWGLFLPTVKSKWRLNVHARDKQLDLYLKPMSWCLPRNWGCDCKAAHLMESSVECPWERDTVPALIYKSSHTHRGLCVIVACPIV